jgi:tRNA modification GTPase
MNADSIGYGDESPIAALATARAESALALIRLSGKNAVDLAAGIFSRPEKLRAAAGNTIVHGWIVEPSPVDEVMISVYRAPKSYTGEDSADICCHGGTAVTRAIMRALLGAGFRNALPGEFTFRAFMNGKLDLTRAEAVMELVSAKTDPGLGHAAGRLSGILETEIRTLRDKLVQILAAVELRLDYEEGEDDQESSSPRNAVSEQSQAEEILLSLRTLAASWRRERIYQEGVLAVIAGRPNAGKSSLFNYLLKEDRAIVTETPGATRDWIEARLSIEGSLVRLVDTAGLRNSDDPIEKQGIERSRKLLSEAELILYVIDGAEGIAEDDEEFLRENGGTADDTGGTGRVRPLLLIWNKADLGAAPAALRERLRDFVPFIELSSKTGAGIQDLTKAIVSALEAAEQPAAGISENIRWGNQSAAAIGSARQKELIDAAAGALEEALSLSVRGEPLDLIAPALREAVDSLGEITGEVSTEDILNAMFSRFCVGK